MSKEKRGMFRRIVDVGRKMMGKPVTHHYPEPVAKDPKERKKKRASGGSSGRFAVERIRRHRYPPCEPGTIAFHDKCVRYYGAKKARQIGRDLRHKDRLGNLDRLDRVPNEANFAALTPWAWRNQTEHADRLRIPPPSKL
jgi:hypothetical protein